jgi:hypothetical protein
VLDVFSLMICVPLHIDYYIPLLDVTLIIRCMLCGMCHMLVEWLVIVPLWRSVYMFQQKKKKGSSQSQLNPQQIQVCPMTRKWVLKLLPSSLSLLRHIMNPKLQFFNVLKSHLMPKFSRIYARKRANLGTIVLRKSFEASKLTT